MEAFVYCWTDFGTNRLYIGVHKGSTDDGYVCSSKIMKEHYMKRPHDFSRQILAQGTFDDCYSLETAILKATKADKNCDFYNQHTNNGKFYCKEFTEARNLKISNSLQGRKRPEFSDTWKRNIGLGIRHSVRSQTHYNFMRTSEGRKKNSAAQTNSLKHKESRDRLRGIFQGPCQAKRIPKSLETREKMREARLKYWENKKLVKHGS
jgi:hypothetical protein